MADVEKLIRVVQRLVDAGNTVVIIEHNLDIVAEADWIDELPSQREGAHATFAAIQPVVTVSSDESATSDASIC